MTLAVLHAVIEECLIVWTSITPFPEFRVNCQFRVWNLPEAKPRVHLNNRLAFGDTEYFCIASCSKISFHFIIQEFRLGKTISYQRHAVINKIPQKNDISITLILIFSKKALILHIIK